MIINLEHILCDDRLVAAASSAPITVENPPIVPQSSEAALQELDISVTISKGEEMYDGLADRSVSEECPTSRMWHTHLTSSARLENTMSDQIVSIPALVPNAAISMFRDAGRATESILGHEGHFRDPSRGQESAGQRYSKCRLLFCS